LLKMLSILSPLSSILYPLFSLLYPPFSILHSLSSILYPLFSLFSLFLIEKKWRRAIQVRHAHSFFNSNYFTSIIFFVCTKEPACSL
jgi:hypothetical protein